MLLWSCEIVVDDFIILEWHVLIEGPYNFVIKTEILIFSISLDTYLQKF